MVDVNEGHEADFLAVAREFSSVLARKEYGRADIVRDETPVRRIGALGGPALASDLLAARPTVLVCGSHGFLPVSGLGHDLNVAGGLEHGLEPRPHHRLVIGDHDPEVGHESVGE